MSNIHQANVDQASFAANIHEQKVLALRRQEFEQMSRMNHQLCLNHAELHKWIRQLQEEKLKCQEESRKYQQEIISLKAELMSQQSLLELRSSLKDALGSCNDQEVGPSDSISQQPSRSTTPTGIRPLPMPSQERILVPQTRPSIRPAHLPFEVLWCKEDCSKDASARPTQQNPSRPPMRHAIRYEDGSTVPTSHYNAIMRSGNRFVDELFQHHRLCWPSEPPPTMSGLKRFYPKEWRKAILEFEMEHRVLTCCRDNWKAEQVLGNIIRGRKKVPVANNNADISTLKRKRSPSQSSAKQAAKKLQEEPRGL